MKKNLNFEIKSLFLSPITHIFIILGFAAVITLKLDEQFLLGIYSKFQTALFTGFLTIGGFLLSLKTFILVKMRDDLYDSKVYKKRFAEKKLLNENLKLYGPLRRLGDYLVYCVICALLTAILQITLGFVKQEIAAAICIVAALFTMFLVIFAWWQIKLILSDWFDILDSTTLEGDIDKN